MRAKKGLAVVVLLVLAACEQKKPAPVPPAPPDLNDYSTPALTRQIVALYVASLVEERRLRFKDLVPTPTGPDPIPRGEALAEADAFARKYGFTDYVEYTRIDERITIGRMILLKPKIDGVARDLIERRILTIGEKLKREDLTPADREAAQFDLQVAFRELDGIRETRPNRPLNAEDLDLVREFESQIEIAETAAAKSR